MTNDKTQIYLNFGLWISFDICLPARSPASRSLAEGRRSRLPKNLFGEQVGEGRGFEI